LSALMDGAAITAIRTAAVSGVATDLLARPDAGELAILGAGVQARTHLEAIAAVRPLRKVRIWSRNAEHAAALSSELRPRFQVPIEAATSPEAAVRSADIIATVTASPEPILEHRWLKEGVHINAVGSSIPTSREIDTATMVAARLFVDRRESALAEAGDLLIAMGEGAVKGDHVQAELGEVIIGKDAGRRWRGGASSDLAKGALVASAGNMAQGAAWNARRLGVPCTVIAPDHAPDTKVAAIERLGGRVIKVPFDRWWQTFSDRSYPGVDAVFIHSFDDDRVMAGNGTIGLELLEDLPEVDTVLIPWGGGGLAGGIATALRALKPAVRIYAVETETGAPLYASMKAGSPQVADYEPSFVDGIGSKT